MAKKVKVKSSKEKKVVDYSYHKRAKPLTIVPKTFCIITRFAFLVYAVLFTCLFCYLIFKEPAYKHIINILLVLIAQKELSTTILSAVYFGGLLFVWFAGALVIFLSYFRKYVSWRSRKQTINLSIIMITVSLLFIAVNFIIFVLIKYVLVEKHVPVNAGKDTFIKSEVNALISDYKIYTIEFISLNILEGIPLVFGFWLLYEARLIRKGIINVIKKPKKSKKPLFDKVMDGFFDFGEEYSPKEIRTSQFDENSQLLNDRTIDEFVPA